MRTVLFGIKKGRVSLLGHDSETLLKKRLTYLRQPEVPTLNPAVDRVEAEPFVPRVTEPMRQVGGEVDRRPRADVLTIVITADGDRASVRDDHRCRYTMHMRCDATSRGDEDERELCVVARARVPLHDAPRHRLCSLLRQRDVDERPECLEEPAGENGQPVPVHKPFLSRANRLALLDYSPMRICL